MSSSPAIFPFWHIALTATITAGITFLVLLALRYRFKTFHIAQMCIVAIVVGLSVLLWREAGNTAALNNDPIPGVSPNDVLCPLVTYLFLGMYGAFGRPQDAARWEQVWVWLTLISFVINVITI